MPCLFFLVCVLLGAQVLEAGKVLTRADEDLVELVGFNLDGMTSNWFDAFPRILHIGCRSANLWQGVYKRGFEARNPGWHYDFLTDQRIHQLEERFPREKAIMESKHVSGVELSDIGRLLSLQSEGGIYVDSDVKFHESVAAWLPKFHIDQDVDMVVGIEFPRWDDFRINPIQIANFCMASKPNNPILKHALDRIMANLQTIPHLRKLDTLKRTGPIAFTSAILETLQSSGVRLPNVEQAFDQGNGSMFKVMGKKVVILPYRSFGFHPQHGPDVNKWPMTDHLIQHEHKNRWR